MESLPNFEHQLNNFFYKLNEKDFFALEILRKEKQEEMKEWKLFKKNRITQFV